MNNQFVTTCFETLFYGFCFNSFISYFLSISNSENINRVNTIFFKNSIKLIKWIGVIYLLYKIIDLSYYYHLVNTDKEYSYVIKRATGPYAWAYWMLLLRPVFFSLLTQLFWLERFKKKGILNFIAIFVIFLVVLLSGINFERFIIIITSIHRDYLPSSWNTHDIRIDENWYIFPLLFFGLFIQRSAIYFLFVVSSSYLINKIRSK